MNFLPNPLEPRKRESPSNSSGSTSGPKRNRTDIHRKIAPIQEESYDETLDEDEADLDPEGFLYRSNFEGRHCRVPPEGTGRTRIQYTSDGEEEPEGDWPLNSTVFPLHPDFEDRDKFDNDSETESDTGTHTQD